MFINEKFVDNVMDLAIGGNAENCNSYTMLFIAYKLNLYWQELNLDRECRAKHNKEIKNFYCEKANFYKFRAKCFSDELRKIKFTNRKRCNECCKIEKILTKHWNDNDKCFEFGNITFG